MEHNLLDAKAWLERGLVLRDLGRDGDALNCDDHAVGINPSLVRPWGSIGVPLCGSEPRAGDMDLPPSVSLGP